MTAVEMRRGEACLAPARPAILSLIALFIIGTILLLFVDVKEGRRVAQSEDAAAQMM